MLALLRCKGFQSFKPANFLTRKNVSTNSIKQKRCQVRCARPGLVFVRSIKQIRYILTFDPVKLQAECRKVHDISNKKILLLRFRTVGGPSSVQFRFLATKDANNLTQDIPFPPKSRGVFYYHLDPQLPPISGGIRFRLCDSLEKFYQSEDLRIKNEKPWDIPLIRIAYTDNFRGLARFLVEEGLVEKKLIQDLRQLKTPSRFVGLYLYDLTQPFVIDLETTAFTIHLITRKTFSSTLLVSPFYNSSKGCSPYSGTPSASSDPVRLIFPANFLGLAKVRFELLELKEKGPTLVLRILEFISPLRRVLPLDSGSYIEPASNTLAMRRTASGILKPWTYPIDARSDGVKWTEFLSASKYLKH